MTREEQIIKIGAQFAIDETDGQTSGRAASMRSVLLSAFRAGAHWADQHPQWIPVDEKLPEEGQEVFAWNGTFKESYKCIYHNGLFEDYLGALGKGAVTHWMEIVPPQGKEDRE